MLLMLLCSERRQPAARRFAVFLMGLIRRVSSSEAVAAEEKWLITWSDVMFHSNLIGPWRCNLLTY